jgi:prepilin-type N-terminal cleavage/methylation domain-containing protein
MRRGFTLIEIMIVIAVIAILAGIALPYFKGMQDEGNSAKAAGELRTLATAVESYYIHNDQTYPNQSVAVDPTWQASLPGDGPTIVAATLYDPFVAGGSTEYRYATSHATTSEYYIIFSVGPDDTAGITGIGTDGAIAGTVGDDIYFTNAEAGVGGF